MSFLIPLARAAMTAGGSGRLAAFTAGRMAGGNKESQQPQPENPTISDVAGTNK